MIPRKIHYCWFGGGEMPLLARRCIESWRRFMPDYEIIEWNETNFDVSSNQYARQAYEARKFAFVTDYARLRILADHGGIYMDTDVEVLRPLNEMLQHTAFSGFENEDFVPTGIMASEKGGRWVTELLKYYDNRTFTFPDGSVDMTTNTTVITDYMVNKGLTLNNRLQEFPGLVTIYPSEYFCPKDVVTGRIHKTANTHCIHHFAGSWQDPAHLRKLKINKLVARIFGKGFLNLLYRIKHRLEGRRQ